jgi:hypothetical protein
MINDCVAYVQFGAITGNGILLAMWEKARQSVATMTTTCRRIGTTNMPALEGMSTEWGNIQKFLNAVPPPTTRAPVPVATTPPRTGSSSCNRNYSGCVPNASDVDCASGSGNGPAYISGPVYVTGNDVYGLDRDGDGVGCE